MDKKPSTSDLLALRDGEPVTAQLRQTAAQDDGAQARLAQLHEIKTALRGLPELVPDEQTWMQIRDEVASRRLAREHSSREVRAASPKPNRDRLRYPMATAAGVFFAAVLGSILWMPQLRVSGPTIDTPGPALAPAAVATSERVADSTEASAADTMTALIDRSRRLEAVARLPVARAIDGQERSRQALLYRIADLDAQLNSLIEEEPMDPELKERLWQQRVALLETLVAVQQDQLRRSPSLY